MQNTMTGAHKAAALIPRGQYAVCIKQFEAFDEALERLEQRLAKCPAIGATAGMREHPAMFHYFYDSTDIYICEFDGKDTMFGYIISCGNIQNSKWGYSSLSELISVPEMNIDYFFEEQSIERALHRRYPLHFNNPASLEK